MLTDLRIIGHREFHTSSQCTFWCRVLTDGKVRGRREVFFSRSQCTFWCRVLTDLSMSCVSFLFSKVSMHLLVPGAYRPDVGAAIASALQRLNAPSGAGCLPTIFIYRQNRNALYSLNAPSGAGCLPTQDIGSLDARTDALSQCTFWCRVLTDPTHRTQPSRGSVSMHLLVPGAYRLELLDKRSPLLGSQCTFWCRVLTDCRLCKPRRSTVYSTVIATGDPCTLTHR